ncbi:MAG TPA: LptF/LptG family permease, partial [Pirellulales bacterium]|nr:LptF/LptG family permease [Pirellulales bacterium]
IIDRYLLMQFLKVFVICFFSLTGLYIVIDGFSYLDEFMSYADKHGKLLPVMGEYYAYKSLSFFDRTSGILTLIAAMFTVTWIQRHNELTALEAAGLSRGRIIKPVIVAVGIISLLAALNREMVIPRVRGSLGRTPQNLDGKTSQSLEPKYDNATNIMLRGAETIADEQCIVKPDFVLPPEMAAYGKQHIMADRAYYRPAFGDKPAGYLFDQLQQPKSLDHQASIEQDGKRVLLTPRDTPWLKSQQCFVVSGVSYEQLQAGSSWQNYSSLSELIAGLRNPSLGFSEDVRVAIHSRLVQPLLDVTLLFLGLPLVLSRKNRNMFLAIGLSVILVVWFMGLTMACQFLGSNYYLVSPALAAWLPLMIFIPWAAGTADVLLE